MPSGAYGDVEIQNGRARKRTDLYEYGSLGENNITEAIIASSLADRNIRNIIKVYDVSINAEDGDILIEMEVWTFT